MIRMSDSVTVRPVSVEKCLDVIPNKFRLAVIVMNRAKDLQMKAKPDAETLKFARKSINKTLHEIRSGRLDIPLMEDKIRRDLLTNNLFPKSSKNIGEESSSVSDDSGSLGFEPKNSVSHDESYENKEEIDGEEVEEEDDGDYDAVLSGTIGEVAMGGDAE
jgi:DNA-directed RNA polymerase omega subunit